MGRGLSRTQRIILGLLDGSVEGAVYEGLDQGCDTAELLEELLERGFLRASTPRKQRMFTVVRACRSLERRGLLLGTYVTDAEHPHCRTIRWRSIG